MPRPDWPGGDLPKDGYVSAKEKYPAPRAKNAEKGYRQIALLGYEAAQLTAEKTADYEGYIPQAYQCPAGVWTKCFGSTEDVTPGATYTFEECQEALNDHLVKLTEPILRCVPSLGGQPDKVKVAAASMAYNIGPAAFCKSSVARYFNAGDYERGCRRMAEIYTTAKGKELPGLVRRRGEESAMCLEGLREARPLRGE